MSKTIWRVEWDIDHGKGPHTSLEFTEEEKAVSWAEGVLSAGGRGIVVTELIVGRALRFNAPPPLFRE